MQKLQIFYLSCTCSERMYKKLFENTEFKPGQQVQKYHRLFAKGFELNGNDVEMITALPLTKNTYNRKFFRRECEVADGLKYFYLSIINIPILKHISVVWQTMFNIVKHADKERQTIIICDILNQSVALGGVLASKILRCKCIGIVTDLPDMLAIDRKSLGTRFNNWMLEKYTDYIFLTEEMNDRINKESKPYIVLEGHVDSNIGNGHVEKKYNKFVCLYAGALSKKYGLHYLVEGFLMAQLENAELHLYGDGDYVPELQEICRTSTTVKYFGVKLNDYVVKEQKKATLLVNPRPTNEEFTKYSFPSKNMEYMLSGTPVLTTCLPGMPKDYYPYVYLIDKENSEGFAAKLRELYEISREELEQKGKKARMFVLNYKNNKVQAGKVMEKLML